MGLLLFLSSGLFLGWSLGANDAANVFGTAVGARMVRFRTAALVCAVFVVLGATISGAGAAHTLGRLGAVNALPGAFTVALAAGLTTFWMTRLKLPVSTSQAIVGAIIGWNLYTASVTDTRALSRDRRHLGGVPAAVGAPSPWSCSWSSARRSSAAKPAPAAPGCADPLGLLLVGRLRLLQPGRQQHRQRDGGLRPGQPVPRPRPSAG